MVEIRKIKKDELDEAYKLFEEYVGGQTKEEFYHAYSKNPNLFIGCFSQRMIGMVWGELRDELKEKVVIVQGIAVLKPYWRKGIGTRLLKALELEARKLGARKLSVGSARGVEEFYMENGFKPTGILLITKTGKKYIPVRRYSRLESLARKRDAEAVYILDKEL